MYEVKDSIGLHARPASRIFAEARRFLCSIEAEWESGSADCKSLMALMDLGVKKGGILLFRFDGEDEDEALIAVRTALESI